MMIDSGDTAWVLTSSALVFIMVPGLAFFYAGLVRGKNALSTLMQSFIALAIVGLSWILWGYSLAFGPDIGGFIGNLQWAGLHGVSATEAGPYADTIPHQAFMVFQAKFAIITPALIAGAFAERIKFSTFVIFIIAWSVIVYPPLAHWMWGNGGWLGEMGALDFAGGSVVHISSGAAALAAAIIFGRRLGLGQADMNPHNVPFVVLGASLLWFGWFGFNAGSSLSSMAAATSAFVVTHASAATAAVVWVALDWILNRRPSVVGAATGAVAGLATITPASGFVGPMPAVVIGLGAGAMCYAAVWLKTRVRLDDSLDVFAIHGVGGTWGMLAVGLFIGVGFMTIGELTDLSRGEQIVRQLIAIGVSFGWAFVVTIGILFVLKYTIGLRVDEQQEEEGLDISQHGEEAYTVRP
jgi:Amt family ammonium transporter